MKETIKKAIIGILSVLVLSLAVFNVKSQEFFVKIKNLKQTVPVYESLKEDDGEKKNSEDTVRIILKENNGASIYHTNVSLKAKNLVVYYGENYGNKKSCKKIEIKKNDKLFKKSDVLKVEGKNAISWNRNGTLISYSGMFYIYNTSSGLVLVNEVDMDDYVAGVIASEIGEDNPEEALKAQAVCARTFISRSNPKEYKKYSANGDDSVSYQVYNREEAGKKCIQAAKDTTGQIMTYKKKPITAYYFSTSCGYTTDYKIWGRKKLKYLAGGNTLNNPGDFDVTREEDFKEFITSVPKAYESEYPFYRWNVYVSNEQVQNAISSTIGQNTGNIRKIEVNSRGTGGIVSQLTVYGKTREIIISNQNQIRKALCSYYAEIHLNDGSTRTKMEMLPSAFIDIENVYKNGEVIGFKIYGGGFGHGSGMSQNGAIEMAKKGLTYDKILKAYYKGIKITSL